MKISRTTQLWIVALQLALVLPFIAQPLHIDDGIYLDIGRNFLKMPWQAHDFPYIFEGRAVPDMASHSHPPFVGYWIGILLWAFGEGPYLEIKLHAGFLIFPLLFAAGMYRLARRFTDLPALASVLAITSPVAIVMSHSLMADYPSLAFTTLGLALYIDGVDQHRKLVTWAGGLSLALAAFCSYPAVVTAGLAGLYGWMKRWPSRAALWSPLIAPAWMAVWVTYCSLYFGRFVLSATVRHVVQTGGLDVTGLTHKLLAFPIFLGATFVLPLPLIRVTLLWRRATVAVLWVLVSAGLVQSAAASYALRDRILLIAFLALGGWIIVGILLRSQSPAGSRQDAVFLVVWTLLMGFTVILTYTSGMARYLLAILPPVVLLAFLKSAEGNLSALRRSALFGVTIGLSIGIVLSVADFQMARIHKTIALNLQKIFSGREQQVRFGGEWGFRHYMLEEGFRQYLSTGDDFAGGQFLVLPQQAVPYTVPQDVESILVPVQRESWQSPIPIRLMNRQAHAGFYSSAWGLLPFSVSRTPVEDVAIYQVSYLAEKLPEINLQNPDRDAVIVPSPAPGRGVDISVPASSRLTIPYDAVAPTRVRFSCIGKCALRALYDQSELELHREATSYQFDLPGPARGTIVLDVSDAVTIRNWLMLPSAGAPWS